MIPQPFVSQDLCGKHKLNEPNPQPSLDPGSYSSLPLSHTTALYHCISHTTALYHCISHTTAWAIPLHEPYHCMSPTTAPYHCALPLRSTTELSHSDLSIKHKIFIADARGKNILPLIKPALIDHQIIRYLVMYVHTTALMRSHKRSDTAHQLVGGQPMNNRAGLITMIATLLSRSYKNCIRLGDGSYDEAWNDDTPISYLGQSLFF